MDSHRYDDIISLPHPVSAARKHMTPIQRAAQFAPFAALTGYEEALGEAARLTESQIDPGDWRRAELDEKFRLLLAAAPLHPALTVTYFQPDEKKQGGKYAAAAGTLKKLKISERELVLTDGTVIPLDAVFSIDGEIFRRQAGSLKFEYDSDHS